jgi:hypothetical protein
MGMIIDDDDDDDDDDGDDDDDLTMIMVIVVIMVTSLPLLHNMVAECTPRWLANTPNERVCSAQKR